MPTLPPRSLQEKWSHGWAGSSFYMAWGGPSPLELGRAMTSSHGGRCETQQQPHFAAGRIVSLRDVLDASRRDPRGFVHSARGEHRASPRTAPMGASAMGSPTESTRPASERDGKDRGPTSSWGRDNPSSIVVASIVAYERAVLHPEAATFDFGTITNLCMVHVNRVPAAIPGADTHHHRRGRVPRRCPIEWASTNGRLAQEV